MSQKYKCGDSECWCATMTGLVTASDSDSKQIPVDLQRHPFHRGWWREREAAAAKEKK